MCYRGKFRNSTLGCDPVCLVQTPFRASSPKWGKNRKTVGFGLPRKIGKNWPKNRKNGPKMGKNWVWGHFSYFSANFSLFSGGGRNLYFSYSFPISGWRPETGSVPGKQHPKRWEFKGRPNHDHDHFWVHLAGPRFSCLGYAG